MNLKLRAEILIHRSLIFDNSDRKKTKESVLRVLKKVVDLFNLNLQKNADGLLATRPHNKDILWVGEVENMYLKINLPFLIK